MPFYETCKHYRWLSVVEAKTPLQIFDRLSSFVAEMFPSTTSTTLSTSPLRERL